MRIGRILLEGFGWLFCAAWAAAMLAFPLVKGVPAGYVPVVVGAALGIWALRGAPRVQNWVDALSPARFLTTVIGVALVLRMAAVWYFPLEPMVDDQQFHRYAISMLQGQGYGAPSYRAWFPPGMSLLLTAWYFVTTPSPLAGKMLQIGLGAVLVWQSWAAMRAAFSERAARLAAVLVAVFPTLVFYTATLGYEVLLALILVAVCRLATYVATGGRDRGLALVSLGALAGVGSLVKPICLLLPILLALGWWFRGLRLPAVVSRASVVVAAMVLLICPWTIRNYRVLGAFVPISTNGGTTLYAANNPRANGLAMTVQPLADESNEVSRDRLRMRAAFAWMLANPRRWSELALVKAVYTWGTASSIMSVVSTDRLPPLAEDVCKAILNAAWAALLVWCVWATATVSPWRSPGLTTATLIIAYVFAIHLFYEALSRHHVPIVPLLCMVAAAGTDRVTTAGRAAVQADSSARY